MKKHWLRGLLSGVSMALLVAGGVALAASLWVTVDKPCVQCFSEYPVPPDDAYWFKIRFGGYDTNEELCERVTIGGELLLSDCSDPPPKDPQGGYDFKEPIPCEWGDIVPDSVLGRGVSAANAPPGPLGEWNWRLWQPATGDSVQVSFLVARVCEAMFVPEPGSILLLGSGLVGLAGYASLRLRSGQALPWTTRE